MFHSSAAGAFLVFLATLPGRWITYDDAYFAEQAYWFSQLGYVRTTLFAGILDWEKHILAYHKLHIWQGSLLPAAGLWDAYFFKLLPLIYLAIFLLVAGKHFAMFSHGVPRTRAYILFLFYVIGSSYVVQFGFEFRPEVMMMTVGFVSYHLLRRAQATRDQPRVPVLFAGGAAGLAALFHLNGLAFAVAGVLLLVYQRHITSIPVFISGFLVIASLYFADLDSLSNLRLLIYQLTHDPALGGEQSFSGTLAKLITAPRRWLSHPYDVTHILVAGYALWLNRRRFRHNREIPTALTYFLGLDLTLAAISPQSKTMYLILSLPYLGIITAQLARRGVFLTRHTSMTAFALLSLFVLTQLGHDWSIWNHRNRSIVSDHARVASLLHLTPDTQVVAPPEFVFNEIRLAKIRSISSAYRAAGCTQPAVQCRQFWIHVNQAGTRHVLIPRDHYNAPPDGLPRDAQNCADARACYRYSGKIGYLLIYSLDQNH